jgi:prepilin-type N-terminal cleavage/methylation domain-containing protein
MKRTILQTSSAFTLLEIMIALGILAVGMSAALGLFAAAAASGRRAEQAVQAAHVADTVFAGIEGRLTMLFDHAALENLTEEQAGLLGLELPSLPLDGGVEDGSSGESDDGMGGGSGSEDDGSEDDGSEGDGSEGDGLDSGEGPGDGGGDPDMSPKVFLAGEEYPDFPDFKVWAILTPLAGQSEQPIAFFCEVHVQWSIKGRKRGQQYRTVLLRRLSKVDIPSLSGLDDDE